MNKQRPNLYDNIRKIDLFCRAIDLAETHLDQYTVTFDYLFMSNEDRKSDLLAYVKYANKGQWKVFKEKHCITNPISVGYISELTCCHGFIGDFIINDLCHQFNYETVSKNMQFLVDYIILSGTNRWVEILYLFLITYKEVYGKQPVLSDYLDEDHLKIYRKEVIELSLKK